MNDMGPRIVSTGNRARKSILRTSGQNRPAPPILRKEGVNKLVAPTKIPLDNSPKTALGSRPSFLNLFIE